MVNQQVRFWVRRFLFLLMVGLIAWALYQSLNDEQSARPEVGDQAPDFTLTTLDGKERSLKDLRGKAVMINFWATWCEPCRKEMPAMQKVYEKYKDKGFEIVAINIAETDVAAASFARQYGLTFPIWMDREREVTQLYKIGPIPSSFFVDPDGNITQRYEVPFDIHRLEATIQPILPKK